MLQLSIGDVDEHPDESIQFEVEIQKAVQKASGKSMQKMRKGAWDKSLESTAKAVAGKKRRRDEDADEEAEDEDDEQDRQALHEPGALTVQKVSCLYLLIRRKLMTLASDVLLPSQI